MCDVENIKVSSCVATAYNLAQLWSYIKKRPTGIQYRVLWLKYNKCSCCEQAGTSGGNSRALRQGHMGDFRQRSCKNVKYVGEKNAGMQQ